MKYNKVFLNIDNTLTIMVELGRVVHFSNDRYTEDSVQEDHI
jgi:hypothetical protein